MNQAAIRHAIEVGTPEEIKDFILPLLDLLKEEDEGYVWTALYSLEDILQVRGFDPYLVAAAIEPGADSWLGHQEVTRNSMYTLRKYHEQV